MDGKRDMHIPAIRGGARVFAWGGGGKMAKFLAEHCASPEKGAQRGGGGGGISDTLFFRPKNLVAILLP